MDAEKRRRKWSSNDHLFIEKKAFLPAGIVRFFPAPDYKIELREVEAGDRFVLQIHIQNNSLNLLTLQQYLLLEVLGLFYFYPAWMDSAEYVVREFSPGYQSTEILYDFIWPDNCSTTDPLKFWLGYFDPQTQSIAGSIDSVSFGF